ncbi:metallophosphoesterase family protein [Sphingomonas sp. HT-1]|uniref:metallophosphoesterase family protein n=1 Tax=unclassified Sphingomonas TaxID=196159 RepID=UPI0002F999C5|nr:MULTISPECIES: metallophosphoesterase [unclassified Sphingomonas]KTF69342.1 metallophosphoesterase [Sphingomonas sp. WG]
MTRLFHVSDIHFGREDQAALDWFEAKVREERPAAIIMTGDLTMRARSHEFAAASEWLEGLGVPMTVEVGNHDLPYFNPLARLTTPYRRYRTLERVIERPLDVRGVSVVPLKTTARFQFRTNWSKGHVSTRALQKSLALAEAVPEGDLIFVAAHHPLIEAGTRGTSRTRNGAEALAALSQAGAHAVLTGHVHDPFDIEHRMRDRVVRLIGAGTLSERTREKPPSFNEITVDGASFSTRARFLGEPSVAL